ncbi:hypothetical protein BDY21DRAFT_292926 [Lineolata rhizophorae]|uniref:BHLH domain-containing protein n=1 Tax=Lineolata rhizophorae TaxID=578093 RepID=A0A6A6NNS3_9PEZI|nr:hypothetical protein BDY21DRAFT_292926 [Lineolata rhizophorae]
MSLNWGSYLNDDGLNASTSNGRWPDISQQRPQPNRPLNRTAASTPASAAAAAAVTSAAAARQTLSLAPSASDISPFQPANQPDNYFSDAYYGNPDSYLLGDLEILEPLGHMMAGGSTTDSSPEAIMDAAELTNGPASRKESNASELKNSNSVTPNTASSSMSPELNSVSSIALETAQNRQFGSLFPNRAQPVYVEDLTYTSAPPAPVTAKKSTSGGSAIPESIPEDEPIDLTTAASSATTTTKRQKAPSSADSISACWTSPLCPNHSKDGSHPDPSTCGGECAPYLFAPGGSLANGTLGDIILGSSSGDGATARALSESSPEGEVEYRPRLKRSESDSSAVSGGGRVFVKPGATELRPRPPVKEESSESPQDYTGGPAAPSVAEEKKPAGTAGNTAPSSTSTQRRRLPHNQVERKYRESLNTQLDSLRRVVPALQQNNAQRTAAAGGAESGGGGGSNGPDIEDLPAPTKPSKAVVLASATAYIKQMEKEKRQLADENALLRSRIKALQALVKCEDCSLMQYVMDLKINNQT